MSRKVVSIKQTSAGEPLLVTVPEAARLLSLSPWTVRRYVRRGLIAAKRISRSKWLIPYKSLLAFATVKS